MNNDSTTTTPVVHLMSRRVITPCGKRGQECVTTTRWRDVTCPDCLAKQPPAKPKAPPPADMTARCLQAGCGRCKTIRISATVAAEGKPRMVICVIHGLTLHSLHEPRTLGRKEAVKPMMRVLTKRPGGKAGLRSQPRAEPLVK